MPRTRLYLDFDDVINADYPETVWGRRATAVVVRTGFRAGAYRIVWAPQLIDELAQVIADYNLEPVWLSTWNYDDQILSAVDLFDDRLTGLRIPEYTGLRKREGFVGAGYWKASVIAADLDTSPTPFIWAEDTEIRLHGDAVRTKAAGIPHLFVEPNPYVGLTPADMAGIRRFLDSL
ncbi:HAD domain-containing protein [Leifsonia sp. Leaf264]|uniref:HAD domain-containing protein n=1 Tax=Leifsonia sp. Leaf264 TaxID=1736314 RepID=UPI0009EC9F15|nr:HAD domain-containing protein [Leifsonia sp. Leaf264]